MSEEGLRFRASWIKVHRRHHHYRTREGSGRTIPNSVQSLRTGQSILNQSYLVVRQSLVDIPDCGLGGICVDWCHVAKDLGAVDTNPIERGMGEHVSGIHE